MSYSQRLPRVFMWLAFALAAALTLPAVAAAAPTPVAQVSPDIPGMAPMLEEPTATPPALGHTKDVTDSTPSHYYVDFRAVPVRYQRAFPFDRNRIIMVKYSWMRGAVYNPVTISQYALGQYERYLHGADATAAADSFLRHATWLRDHMGADGRFRFPFPVPARRLSSGWVSAMAQGQAMSVFVRAYQMTGDASFLRAARLARGAFTKHICSGGVAYTSAATGRDYWLEEYPERPPSHVLNGALFAMYGLWDYHRTVDDRLSKELFVKASATLGKYIDNYEYNGCLLYQLKGVKYAYGYYPLQIEQLRALAAITGSRHYEIAADRWSTLKAYP